MRAGFTVQTDVHKNIAKLREAMGTASGRALSLQDLADMLNERDGGSRNSSTIRRWESGTEPDFRSTQMLAELAGVSFEEFALGVPPRGRRGLTEAEVTTASKRTTKKGA